MVILGDTFTKPDNNLESFLVYQIHISDLLRAFLLISLINAKSIYPEYSRAQGLPKPPDGLEEVLPNRNVVTIAADNLLVLH
jgi:hypothetical protein